MHHFLARPISMTIRKSISTSLTYPSSWCAVEIVAKCPWQHYEDNTRMSAMITLWALLKTCEASTWFYVHGGNIKMKQRATTIWLVTQIVAIHEKLGNLQDLTNPTFSQQPNTVCLILLMDNRWKFIHQTVVNKNHLTRISLNELFITHRPLLQVRLHWHLHLAHSCKSF
jgi:hypothetical protein